jgi:lipopolysaccharide/colanic/teichoic acid biosynthesis glycosyltransferase
MIRFFDLFFSIIALIIFLPFLLLIAVIIVLDSKGGFLFFQKRVGKGNKDFTLIKFRTMRQGSEKLGSLTVGNHGHQITYIGHFLRKYKLDELPQLLNVIKGEMSLVGPRPEVREYVNLYNEEQKRVLQVRPGLTDLASLEYLDENERLDNSSDPVKTYIDEIMPAKLELNKKYLEDRSLKNYFRIIGKTITKILF